jgi:hypothetical protein
LIYKKIAKQGQVIYERETLATAEKVAKWVEERIEQMNKTEMSDNSENNEGN